MIRLIIYNTSHLIILAIVLVFIMQNPGFISLFYIVVCLIFLNRVAELYKSEEGAESFLRLLGFYFINVILLDLTLQIVY
mmetsp:Transcript_7258/g.924  ORF Transcript_7258/g.924 Transcript_7258/m.924 type:complete len:80 (+) Transcript_7258:1425-1664(+)